MGRGQRARSFHAPAASSRPPRWRGWWAAPLLVAVLAAAAPAAVDAQPDEVPWARLPELQIGDFWTFRISGREDGSIHNEVVARETKESHFGKRIDAFRVHSEGTVTSDQADPLGGLPEPGAGQPLALGVATTEHEIRADKWVRHDDYALVQTEGTVSISGITESEILESFDPPLVHVLFPFAEDYKWLAEATWYQERGEEDPTELDVTLDSTVHEYGSVAVPAGTFDAWRLEYNSFRSGATRIVQWWSQEACGIVKEEQYDRDRELVNTLELTEYGCDGESHKDEPDYSHREVFLVSTGDRTPPWLVTAPRIEDRDDGDGDDAVEAGALPGGPLLWAAVAMMAAAAVLFVLVGRRRD